ncbi:hypothetical protein [Agrococcus sp. HG114]|uniref:hypothetical protein n=1 Tax=Agrococcus sp. HG114 TaxID=2969757 RepID=UPI00215AA9C3|nr:hypothetical protein [Agrococcus sp. HG114]MCR8670820.1 hypothetical protein [Agrococcus sp. HG114]
MLSKTSAACTALLVGALVAAGAAPASAQVVERYSFTESDSGIVEDFCGAGIEAAYTYDVEVSGVIRTRGDSEILWFQEHARQVQTFTYDGMTVTDTQPNSLARDHKIVDNGDGTLTITVLLTGGSRLVGEDGGVLAKNDGQIRLLLLVDAESGEILSEELIFGSTGTNDDYCEATLDYWGL